MASPSYFTKMERNPFANFYLNGARITLGTFCTKEECRAAIALAKQMRKDGDFEIEEFKTRAKAQGLFFLERKSKYDKGVARSPTGKYYAQIRINSKTVIIGRNYATIDQAAHAYSVAKRVKTAGEWDLEHVRDLIVVEWDEMV